MSQFLNCVVLWLNKLVFDVLLMSGLCFFVQVVDGQINGENVCFIVVVLDVNNYYLCVVGGEVGLLEGWMLVKVVNEIIVVDVDQLVKWLIVVVIDVLSQVYGCCEEVFGIYQVLVGVVGVYVKVCLVGYLVIGLIVGKVMFGVFLVYGYQVNCLIVFNDSGVLVYVMGKELVVCIMLCIVEVLEKLVVIILLMVYDVSNYVMFGLFFVLLDINNLDVFDDYDLLLVSNMLCDVIVDVCIDVLLKCCLGVENCCSL